MFASLFRYSECMKCRTLLICAVLTSLLCEFSVAADSALCPSTIRVRQELAAPVAGWTPMEDDTPVQLAGITFYDGPPAEKASLVYDQMTKVGRKQIARWRFTPEAGRPIWVSCNYSGTTIELTRGLPSKTTSCEVTYDPQQQISGLPLIEKIACK
jgi:hypothetical protein